MVTEPIHRELAARLGLGESERIARLWGHLCTPEDAKLLLAMPGTAEDLSAQCGEDISPTRRRIEALYRKGVVFESIKGDSTRYRMARDLVQFHDATVLWPEAPRDFLDLWQEYMDTEYPAIVEMIAASGLPAFMRVIPVGKSIEAKGQVLAYEDTVRMIEQAGRIAVTKCTCRLTAGRCNAPIEVCMQLNRGADYAIKRGTGREVGREEAIHLLAISEEAGLVHLSDNKADLGHVICNCCACCCQILPIVSRSGNLALLAPSRYQARVDEAACTGCEVCVPRCPMRAIDMLPANGGAVTVARVNGDRCIGCGVCATACPTEVIALQGLRPPEFIPAG